MGSRNAASKQSSSKSNKSAAKKDAQGSKGNNSGRGSFIDSGMREDLVGIALAVFGIALFVAVIAPGDAMVTAAVSNGIKHAFGLGAYVIPFAFVFWGASYFLKTEGTKLGRLIIGVVIILLAFMSLLSLYSPEVVESVPATLFHEITLVEGGGYVGSGISWVFMTLFGRLIATIILAGIIVAGLVLAGVSISVPFLFIKNFIFQKKEERVQERYEQEIYGTQQIDYAEDVQSGQTRVLTDDPDQTVEISDSSNSPFAKIKGKFGRKKDDSTFDEDEELLDSDITIDLSDIAQDATIALDEASPQKKPKSRKANKTTKLDAQGASASKPKKTQAVPSGSLPTALEGFELPDRRILGITTTKRSNANSEIKQTAAILQQTLEEFSLPAKVVGWLAGPTVTMYKVELPSGVRLAKLTNLADDIALALAAPSVRIAQIPRTSLVGVEIPNKTRTSVLLGDIISNCQPGPLQVAIGEDVDGDKICVDLSKMPHLLIAGTTGSGKSVCLNGMIMTILMRATPAEVRMILIDPKRVEMSLYNGIPHLYVPPVTEPKEAASALKWAVAEMERRLKVFEQVGAKNIGFYNQMIQKGELDDEDGNHPNEMPYIVVVIDELSDLMMVAGKEVEDSIVRIAQLARAAGIHLIIATQRPSSNVVTGMIKANITNRIGLLVATNVDSRVILDQSGAEKLVGNGDMLFSKPEWGKPKRIQGCYVSEAEIGSVVAHLKEQGQPDYHPEILQQQVSTGSGGGANMASTNDEADDPLIWDAAEAVVAAGLGSTSMLQRRLKVGYARAGRIMDMLEAKGVVGPQEGSRARDVLIDSVEDLEALRAFEEQDQEAS